MNKNQRQDAKTQRCEEEQEEILAPSRPGVLAFNESTVESAALAWLEAMGWRIARGPDITPAVRRPRS